MTFELCYEYSESPSGEALGGLDSPYVAKAISRHCDPVPTAHDDVGSTRLGMTNWKNRTMWTGDNLDIMRGMNSESVDLIYLDPPFNSKHNYSAPIGSEAAGAEFKDTWTLSDIAVEWHGLIAEENPELYKVIDATMTKSDRAYLIYMAVRILEMYRILKSTGSIYIHCDPTMSHYLKLVMDAIFGRGDDYFRNEIIWHYRKWSTGKYAFQKNHDIIFFYSKSKSKERVFNQLYMPRAESTKKRFGKGKIVSGHDEYGRRIPSTTEGESEGVRQDDVWPIKRVAPVKQIYPTQKPIALLDRIIKASSNPEDVILDPFCGCATACIAAEKNVREWVGIDISAKAVDLVKSRMVKELGMFGQVIHRTDIPKRTDIVDFPIYKTHKHTLYGLQEGRCNGCKIHFPFRNFTIDHIVPQARGGQDHIENLQLLCGACNSMKGAGTMEELLAKLKEHKMIAV